jgi:hypothetical protein
MAFWQWSLVFLGIILAGGVWIGSITISLSSSSKKLMKENAELLEAIAKLQALGEEKPEYTAPANNLNDSVYEKTAAFLKRKRAQEQKRDAKKRRLISRFSKRK